MTRSYAISAEKFGPDLRELPTLAEQLDKLDAAAQLGEWEYAQTWLEVSDQNGGGAFAFWNNDAAPDAPAELMSGYVFDDLMEQRKLRWQALHDHSDGRENFKPALEVILVGRGRVSDNRRAPLAEIMTVVRAFAATGGRLMITPGGKLETAGDMGLLLKSYYEHGEMSREWRAGKAMERMLRRWRARPTINRIVRALGKPVNGFLVLEKAA